MRKTRTACIALLLGLLASGVYAADKSTATKAKSAGTCKTCHTTLSVILPEKHPSVSVSGISACLKCHDPSKSGGPVASAYFTKMHAKHIAGTPPVDCTVCHQYKPGTSFGLIGSTISWGKPLKEDMALAQQAAVSWVESRNLDAIHAKQNVGCVACHGSVFPVKGDTVENERCSACHGSYADIAARTKSVKQPNRNPHNSHLGEIDCVVCHHAHKASYAYCNGCHSRYDMKIPGGN